MNAGQITEILSLYGKHGWQLSRVLLTDKLREKLAKSIETIFNKSEIVSAEIDAAWLTRDSGKNRVAWELRHLSSTPFALFETFEKTTDEAEITEIKTEMESRLAKLLAKRNN